MVPLGIAILILAAIVVTWSWLNHAGLPVFAMPLCP